MAAGSKSKETQQPPKPPNSPYKLTKRPATYNSAIGISDGQSQWQNQKIVKETPHTPQGSPLSYCWRYLSRDALSQRVTVARSSFNRQAKTSTKTNHNSFLFSFFFPFPLPFFSLPFCRCNSTRQRTHSLHNITSTSSTWKSFESSAAPVHMICRNCKLQSAFEGREDKSCQKRYERL